MAAGSKHIKTDVVLKGVSCQDLSHPWTSHCSLAYLDMWKLAVIGNLKFFGLVYVLQLLMNRKKINKEYLKQQFKSYLRSTLFGTTNAANYLGFFCLLRNIFGKFHHYTVAFLPAFACGFGVMIEERRKQEFYLSSFFTLCTEYVARQLVREEMITLTTAKLCAWHMVLSAAVMYLLRNSRGKQLHSHTNYWFFMPPRSEVPTEDRPTCSNQQNEHNCYHNEPCWIYAIKDASKYLGVGVGLQMLRTLLRRTKILFQHPVYVLQKLLTWKNISLGMYLGSYVLLYNIINCMLYRCNGGDSEWHAIPAGFIAGSAFIICPNLSLFFMATTTILQELIKRGISLGIVPSSRFIMLTFFSILNGVLFHSRLYDEEICRPFVVNMISRCSGQLSENIIAKFKRFKKIHEETQ